MQIAKDEKEFSGEDTRGVAGQTFPKETRHGSHGSQQPSQQKSGIKMGLSRKDLWKTFLCDVLDPHKLYRRPTRFLKMLYQ